MSQTTATPDPASLSLKDLARTPLRALYHLALYSRHLSNGVQVWRARNMPAALPPLRFRDGSIWHHGPHDEPLLIMRELYGQGFYPKLVVPQGADVIDIGANIGAVTMRWAIGRPDLRFHCYEPNPQAFETLRQNVGANGLDARVTLHAEAVGRAKGKLDLWIDVPTAHSTAFGESPFPGGRRVSTPVVSLDEAWARTAERPIAMLKIDAEGGEVDILEGASQAALAAVQCAIVEYHDNLVPGAYARCRAVLKAAGFACHVHEHPWQEGIITATRV